MPSKPRMPGKGLCGLIGVVALILGCAGTYRVTNLRAQEFCGGHLDRFSGLPVRVSDPSPFFQVRKVGDRWMLVTPEGNSFWMLAVYNVNVSGSVDDRKISYAGAAMHKYGDANVTWGPQQNRRLKAWGFNATAEYSSRYVQPTATSPAWPEKRHPVPMPFTVLVWPSYYSLRNAGNHADRPVKELVRAAKQSVYRGWRAHSPDLWDANYARWLAGAIQRDFNIHENLTGPGNDYLIGLHVDDTDWLQGFGAGADFKTVANGLASGGREQPHLAWIILITPPEQAANAEFNLVYEDPAVYSKRELAAFLASRYRSVAALNAAWGAAYTSFDSTAASPGEEAVGTGDGETRTFQKKLRHFPITPFTLRVKLGGRVVAGDSGDGALRGAVGAGSVEYAAGGFAVTFSSAPAAGAAITVEYKTRGWGDGTGLLDEDGSSIWIPKDFKRLSDASEALRKDLDDFLYHHACRYFADVREVLNTHVPGRLYLGPTYLGTWGTPPRRQILQAARAYVDVVSVYSVPPGVEDDQERIEFIARYAGDKPWLSWEGMMANPDSYFHAYPPPDAPTPHSQTQEERGRVYAARVEALLHARTSSGTYPLAGMKFWELADNWGEKANWGLTTRRDNAYDGVEARTATGKDASGYPIGGEERDYGDFLSAVHRANCGALEVIRTALRPLPPPAPATGPSRLPRTRPPGKSR